MKQAIFFGLMILAMGSMLVGACNPPTIFSHTFTDWYRGLDLSQTKGLYFELGSPMTNYEGCDPALNWTYAWEDGLYLFGNWGGSGYTCVRECPFPWTKPSSRMVVALASPGLAGTKFILDSVLYNDALGRYELDASQGVIHLAGSLTGPSVVSESEVTRGRIRAHLEIPIPRLGFNGDTMIVPETLVAGIAVLGKKSLAAPSNLAVGEFQLLKIIPVNLRDFDKQPNARIETDVELLSMASGRGYFAYTLVLENGGGGTLNQKPLLPFVSPAVTAASGLATARSMEASAADLDAFASGSAVMKPSIVYVTAYEAGGDVELEWRTSGDPAGTAFRLLRSMDRLAWEEVEITPTPWGSVNGTTIYKVFNSTDGFRFEGNMGAVYQIRLVDDQSGEILSTVTTRARQR
jgi:hypothetical protein